MVTQDLKNMDPAVKSKLLKTYTGHREHRALDPFTQTKAILDLAGHAEIAEEEVRELMAQIDNRASTVMNSIPGFTADAGDTTPPRAATAPADATQGVTLTTQPPAQGGLPLRMLPVVMAQ